MDRDILDFLDDVEAKPITQSRSNKPSRSAKASIAVESAKIEVKAVKTEADETFLHANEAMVVTNTTTQDHNSFMLTRVTVDAAEGYVRKIAPNENRIHNSFLNKRYGAVSDKSLYASMIKTNNIIKAPYKWMNHDATDISNSANERVESLCAQIIDDAEILKESLPEEEQFELLPVGNVSYTPALYVGRVVCDSEGRLNQGSMMLEAPRAFGGNRAQLLTTLCKTPVYVAPGQVIGVIGTTNEHGDNIYVRQVIHGVKSTHIPTVTADRIKQIRAAMGAGKTSEGNPFHISAAAGPFHVTTLSNVTATSPMVDLSFEPLRKVLELAQEQQPHALVLLGPFLPFREDAITTRVCVSKTKMQQVASAALAPQVEGESAPTVDFLGPEEIWREVILNELLVPFCRRNTTIQVCVVPHVDDLLNETPVPQPPFTWSVLSMGTLGKPENLQLLSNPSIMQFGDMSMQVASHTPGELFPFVGHMIPISEDKSTLCATTVLKQDSLFWMDPMEDTPIEPSKRDLLSLSHDLAKDVSVVLAVSSQTKPGVYATSEDHRAVVLVGPVSHKVRPTLTNMFVYPPKDVSPETPGDFLMSQNVAQRLRVDIDPIVFEDKGDIKME